MDIDDELLHLKKNLESLAKKEQLLEGEYRTALQQMPDTLEGESLLTEDKQQATGEKEQTVKEEGITPEMPKDQAPGFGDKLGQLWDQAKKTVTDLIE